MKTLQEFLCNNNLKDPEDIDALLEAAEITRQLICDGMYSDISQLINYTIGNRYFEAFTWIMDILQEEFGKEENHGLKDFTCFIGNSISDYNEFIQRLQIDFRAETNDFETTLDNNGEIQSFFNILTYKTCYKNIFLITAENFDTKDNDFIQYKLLFARNTENSQEDGAKK